MSINKRFAHLNHSGSNHSILDAESAYITGTLQVGPAVPALGSDVNFFVSGNIGGQGGATPGVGVFGGDLVVSGNLLLGNELQFNGDAGVAGYALTSSGPGLPPGWAPIPTASPNYWTEEVAGQLFTSASIVHVPSGSVQAVFLSASNGAEVTGSLKVASGNILETLDIGWNSVSLGGGANSALTIQGVNGLVLDADASTLLVTASKTTFVGAGGLTVGSDAVFFVSGNTGESSGFKSVFGGTVFVSGNMQVPFGTKLQSRNGAGSGWVDIAQYADATGLGFGPQVLLLGDSGFNNTGIVFAGDGRPLAVITGSNGFFSGSYKFHDGLSGSLQMLADGTTMFLTGAGGIQITNLANGQIEISGSSQASVTVPQYWTEEVAGEIFTSASIVHVPSGSVVTQFLSASTGVEVSGSAIFAGGGGYVVGSDTEFFVSGAIYGKSFGQGVAVFGGDLVVSGNVYAEKALSVNPIGTGRGLLRVGGLDIGPITGSALTTFGGGGYSLSAPLDGNLLSASFGVWDGVNGAVTVRHELHVVGIGYNSAPDNDYQLFSATYLVTSFIAENGTQTVKDVTELSRYTSGSLASNYDVNFDPDCTIGVTGSTYLSTQPVKWYGQRTKEMSINWFNVRT